MARRLPLTSTFGRLKTALSLEVSTAEPEPSSASTAFSTSTENVDGAVISMPSGVPSRARSTTSPPAPVPREPPAVDGEVAPLLAASLRRDWRF
jgi:hypothetical protein